MIPTHDRAAAWACGIVREMRSIDPALTPAEAFEGCSTWDDVHCAYARQYLDQLKRGQSHDIG